MEEWEVLLEWLEKHAKIWLRFWLENGRYRRSSSEREVHEKIYQRFLSLVLPRICDATETGGTPPVTMTNNTMPPPWRRQAALV